jgi:antitoxin CptB
LTESAADRLKRLKMRSWRRGTKEMDLILGPFADARIATLSDAELKLYDRMLGENDQDLYRWVTGQGDAPEEIAGMIATVAAHAGLLPR